VIGVQVGHHHRRDLRRLDPFRSQLGGRGLVGIHPHVLEQGALDAPEVLPRVNCDRGVEAGIDQHGARAGVLDEERGNRQFEPLPPRDPEAERPLPGQAPVLTQEPRLGADHVAGQQRVEAHARALAAAGQGQLGGPWFGGGRHYGGMRSVIEAGGILPEVASGQGRGDRCSHRRLAAPPDTPRARARDQSSGPARSSQNPIQFRAPRMPASSARRGPRGTSSGISSRIRSYTAS
jgi:hypothetical protein